MVTPEPQYLMAADFVRYYIRTEYPNSQQNIERIANAVQCHNQLSGNKDCLEYRLSIVSVSKSPRFLAIICAVPSR